MKVILTATSLRPEFGGPAVSVSSLAGALSDIGIDVGLWASDRSAAYDDLQLRSGVRPLSGSPAEAFAQFGRPNVIHDNGIWLPHNHSLARLASRSAIPRIVSTRGMLEPWARRHKRWKKSLAWASYQARDLRRAQALHATSEAEANNLADIGLGVPVEMIPNGVDVPQIDRAVRRVLGEERTALFLSRIYPVKGLPMLIEAWAKVRPSGWRLTIAGPDEAGHQAEVARLIARAGLREVVTFQGPVGGEAKSVAFDSADLLVLPSHSESFGMVVAEALAHGVPVLTTTAVPWPKLSQTKCGWRVEPTVAAVAEGLRTATSCDRATLARMGALGRELVISDYSWAHVAARFVAAYERVLAAPGGRNDRLIRAA